MSLKLPILQRPPESDGNPGDIFIATGLRHIYEYAFDDIEWLCLDKFSADQVRSHLSDIKLAGRVVIAGTPQYNNYDRWNFWYDVGFWEEIVFPHNITVSAMAGGSGFPDPRMTAAEFTDDCLSSAYTEQLLYQRADMTDLITVRDTHSSHLLSSLGINSHLLPCSASWSLVDFQRASQGYYVVTPPSWVGVPDGYFNGLQSKPAATMSYFIEIYRQLVKFGKPVVMCVHSKREYDYYSKFMASDALFYSPDHEALSWFYSGANGVISGRLHGALPMLGLNDRLVHLMAVDTRASAADFFPEVSTSVYGDAPSQVVNSFLSGYKTQASLLDEWRDDYVSLIREHF